MSAYICRVCWNSTGWVFPTGEAKGLESPKNYVPQYGFGHEEWLLNFSWMFKGKHYAYLQPVAKSRDGLEGQAVELLLYSISPSKERLLVGRIANAEILTGARADSAHAYYGKMKWLDQMAAYVGAIGGEVKKITNPGSSLDLFNVRFNPADFHPFAPMIPVPATHYLNGLGHNRYQLEKIGSVKVPKTVADSWKPGVPAGTTVVTPVKPISVPAKPGTTYDPVHHALRNHLFGLLDAKYPKSVVLEKAWVDITVAHPNLNAIIEVKSQPDARLAVREGLGQVLEYAYRSGLPTTAPRLVVAAPGPLTKPVADYLALLHKNFGLDLTYVQVTLDTTICPL